MNLNPYTTSCWYMHVSLQTINLKTSGCQKAQVKKISQCWYGIPYMIWDIEPLFWLLISYKLNTFQLLNLLWVMRKISGNLRGGWIGSLFSLLWSGVHIGGHVWRWFIVLLDLARSFSTICAHYHYCVILPAITNMSVWFSPHRKGNSCLTGGLSYKKKKKNPEVQ